jgi:hypothetical protein
MYGWHKHFVCLWAVLSWPVASLNSNDIARFHEFKRVEHTWDESRKVIEVSGASLKDYQRQYAALEALLMRNVLIHRDQYLLVIGETLEACVARRLAIMTSKAVAQRLVNALVQQYAHSTAGG